MSDVRRLWRRWRWRRLNNPTALCLAFSVISPLYRLSTVQIVTSSYQRLSPAASRGSRVRGGPPAARSRGGGVVAKRQLECLREQDALLDDLRVARPRLFIQSLQAPARCDSLRVEVVKGGGECGLQRHARDPQRLRNAPHRAPQTRRTAPALAPLGQRRGASRRN